MSKLQTKRFLKAAREKGLIYHIQGNSRKIFQQKPCIFRREQDDIFKVLKEEEKKNKNKKRHPKMLKSKFSFKNIFPKKK